MSDPFTAPHPDSPPLRVAVLGTGFMGRSHAQRLLTVPHVQIAALCGRTQAGADDARAALGLSAETLATHSFERLLDLQPDALYVCLPPHAHAGQIEQAAARGIHLFLEKPIALTLDRAQAMERAITDAGIVSLVGFHFRFRPCIERLKALVTSGQAGAPTLFTGRFWCNMDGKDWWSDKSRSGGQLFEQLIHMIDLALHLFGPPATAAAFLDNLCHKGQTHYSIEDTSAALVRFRNGALATFTGSNCAVPQHFFADFRCVFQHVTLDLRSTGQPWVQPDEATFYRAPQADSSDPAAAEAARSCETCSETEDLFQRETNEFLHAIRTNQPTRSPIAAGVESVRLAAALVQSALDGGRPIGMDAA